MLDYLCICSPRPDCLMKYCGRLCTYGESCFIDLSSILVYEIVDDHVLMVKCNNTTTSSCYKAYD